MNRCVVAAILACGLTACVPTITNPPSWNPTPVIIVDVDVPPTVSTVCGLYSGPPHCDGEDQPDPTHDHAEDTVPNVDE